MSRPATSFTTTGLWAQPTGRHGGPAEVEVSTGAVGLGLTRVSRRTP